MKNLHGGLDIGAPGPHLLKKQQTKSLHGDLDVDVPGPLLARGVDQNLLTKQQTKSLHGDREAGAPGLLSADPRDTMQTLALGGIAPDQ